MVYNTLSWLALSSKGDILSLSNIKELTAQKKKNNTKNGKNKTVSINYLMYHMIEIIHLFYFKEWDSFGELIRFFGKKCLSIETPGRSFPRKAIIDRGQWYRGKGIQH